MSLFKFQRLIDKYSIPCTLVTQSEGAFIAGDYVDGEEIKTDIMGALLPVPERKMYNSGGYYTAKDRQLYTLAEIDTSTECYIVHNNQKYKVESTTDCKEYADFNLYDLKWVSSFDRPEKN